MLSINYDLSNIGSCIFEKLIPIDPQALILIQMLILQLTNLNTSWAFLYAYFYTELKYAITGSLYPLSCYIF